MTKRDVQRWQKIISELKRRYLQTEDKTEKRRLLAEHDRIWKVIRPYVKGIKKHSE